MKSIKRALISVSDKTGLIPFAQFLEKQKVQILSTGGTLKALKDAGVSAIPVEEFTGFPEILEGRVKTLHPKIHGGLLFRRDKKNHVSEAARHGIQPIDLVVVSLYPFEEVTAKPGVSLETAIENIDIGGPSMLRSAAKNHDAVTVVTDPQDYPRVIQEMQEHKGATTSELRAELARKVFERTSGYDQAIAKFLEKNQSSVGAGLAPALEGRPQGSPLPASLNLHYEKSADIRYGENPHQPAAFYTQIAGAGLVPALAGRPQGSPLRFRQLHGKELSFNNFLDIEAGMDIMREFSNPAACVIKHNNPCGIAEGTDTADALERAIECDAMSAFGGIIAINRACDLKTAQTAFERLNFFEVLIAPDFESPALDFLKKRQNLRIIETGPVAAPSALDMRFLQSGLLVQGRDLPLEPRLKEFQKKLKFVTQKTLESKEEINQLIFAFKCVKVVKSNAIVLTQGFQTVGIGAGQMSRVDSVEIACRKAAYRTEGAFLASDAFFPMPDSIEIAHEKKIRAIIQPGGSIRDADVIAAADRFGIAMVLTGERHFKH